MTSQATVGHYLAVGATRLYKMNKRKWMSLYYIMYFQWTVI